MQAVRHNLTAQFTNRHLKMTAAAKSKSMEKLSSGYQINRSADDAAGLSISEKMRRQIKGLEQASENVQDGISLCQVADGALEETQSILQRMRELSIKAANDTNAGDDRDAIQAEIDELTKEVDKIANTTKFNGDIYLLRKTENEKNTGNTRDFRKAENINGPENAGKAGKITADPEYELPAFLMIREFSIVNTLGKDVMWDGVTYHSGETVSGNYVVYDVNLDPDATWKPAQPVGLYNYDGSYETSNPVHPVHELLERACDNGGGHSFASWEADADGAIYFKTRDGKEIWWGMSKDGKSQALNDYREEPLSSIYFKAVKKDLGGTVEKPGGDQKPGDVGEKPGGIEQKPDVTDKSGDIWIQSGADPMQGMFIKLVDATAKGIGIADLDVTSHEDACISMDRLDDAISMVSSYRSQFGAQQNRLEHAREIDDNTAENLQYAESHIRDTDMAKEMVNCSKCSILEQAGWSMLAQANQSPQGVLSLLQ